MRLIGIVLLLSLTPVASAVEVYKCKGKSGETHYSEHPCDANAQPMKLRDDRSGSTRSSTATVAAPPPSLPANTGGGAEGVDPRENERTCIESATASIYGPSNDRIANDQQQLLALTQQPVTTAENAKATRARMEELRRSISNEHTRVHQEATAARQRCTQQHRPSTPAP